MDETISLAPDDARKLVVVLRKRSGDALEIRDSSGTLFSAELIVEGERGREHVRAHLLTIRETPSRDECEIILAQGIPKGAKMDFAIEKGTELGIAGFIPLLTERTIPTIEPAKLERWRRLARAAAAQCGRERIPFVHEPTSLAGLLSAPEGYDAILMPWELEEPVPLREVLPGLVEGARRILLLIGPEGGFSEDEVAFAREHGARTLSLGRRILRTETAGAVCAALIRYARGEC